MSSVKQIFGTIAAIGLVVGVNLLLPGLGTAIGSTFLASLIGGAVIAIGLTLIQSIVAPGKRSQGTDMEAGKLTVRVPEGPRWIVSGEYRQGGNALFAEFDSAGDLWCVIVHCDSIAEGPYQYYLDDIAVTLSGTAVQNKDFRLLDNEDRDPAEADGAGETYIDIWTTTHTESNPTPPAISALNSALPSKWTTDHRLVGTTYSVMRIRGLELEHRYKIFKWRGPLGLGEPALSVVPASWSNMYDPRDETQTLGDRTTYKPSKNAALVWAWFRTHPYGRRKPESSVNWGMVAEQADICDQEVVGIESTQPRYECSIAIPENKPRIVGEQEIMLSCDGQIVFDDEGKTWLRVGHYEAPTLAFYRNRDILAMESVEAQDGESETQGVIVRYTDPNSDYQVQPSAAWINPLYYVEGEAPQFLTVDIEACQNHNQAMRLAKGIGLRSQPRHKIAPTVSLRGLRARKERFFTLQYDNVFAGDYEIATQVEVDASGVFCGFGAVPVDENRWTLLAGEEKPAPVIGDASGAPTIDNDAHTVTTALESGRLKGSFSRYLYRRDSNVDFQFRAPGSGAWRNMNVDRTTNTFQSDVITETGDYEIRYRTRTNSGAASDWEYTDDVPATAYSNVSNIIDRSWIVEVVNGTSIININADGTLTISDNTRHYGDGTADVDVDGDVIATGLSSGDQRSIAYDDPTRAGGAVTYTLHVNDADARVSASNPYRHYVGFFVVPATGGAGGGGGGAGNGPLENLD